MICFYCVWVYPDYLSVYSRNENRGRKAESDTILRDSLIPSMGGFSHHTEASTVGLEPLCLEEWMVRRGWLNEGTLQTKTDALFNIIPHIK